MLDLKAKDSTNSCAHLHIPAILMLHALAYKGIFIEHYYNTEYALHRHTKLFKRSVLKESV